MAQRPLPLSPHLSVYRFTLTMTMSIVHRATGIALYGGMALLALWMLTAAMGSGAHGTMQAVFGTWFGQLVLFGLSWVLFHHFLGGLRYLIWDTRRLMGWPARYNLALVNLVGSITLTLLAWGLYLWLK